MAHRCRRWRRRTALGRVVDNKVKIRLIGAAAAVDTKAVDVRQDSGVSMASGGIAQLEAELAGTVDAIFHHSICYRSRIELPIHSYFFDINSVCISVSTVR